jgi:hypothetical protein
MKQPEWRLFVDFHIFTSFLGFFFHSLGAKEGDYSVTDDLRILCTDESGQSATTNKASEERRSSLTTDSSSCPGAQIRRNTKDDEEEGAKIGNITFVSCATGSTPGVPSPPPMSPSLGTINHVLENLVSSSFPFCASLSGCKSRWKWSYGRFC